MNDILINECPTISYYLASDVWEFEHWGRILYLEGWIMKNFDKTGERGGPFELK